MAQLTFKEIGYTEKKLVVICDAAGNITFRAQAQKKTDVATVPGRDWGGEVGTDLTVAAKKALTDLVKAGGWIEKHADAKLG